MGGGENKSAKDMNHIKPSLEFKMEKQIKFLAPGEELFGFHYVFLRVWEFQIKIPLWKVFLIFTTF